MCKQDEVFKAPSGSELRERSEQFHWDFCKKDEDGRWRQNINKGILHIINASNKRICFVPSSNFFRGSRGIWTFIAVPDPIYKFWYLPETLHCTAYTAMHNNARDQYQQWISSFWFDTILSWVIYVWGIKRNGRSLNVDLQNWPFGH